MSQAYTHAAATLSQIPVDFVTTSELALYLRCHRNTVQRMVDRGVLQPIQVGRVWRFDKQQAIAALLRARSVEIA